jgi:cobalt-zinc-cadmium resistance protein CzcA
VDRPIFYSVAVIIAGYLPIYALTGPGRKLLFRPMANTMAFALVGALILTLTLRPGAVLVTGSRAVSSDRENPVFEWIRDVYAKALLAWCLRFIRS